jgi:hypothetical protein
MSETSDNTIYYLFPQAFNSQKLRFIKSIAEYVEENSEASYNFRVISFLNSQSAVDSLRENIQTISVPEETNGTNSTAELAEELEAEYNFSFNHLWFPEKKQKNFAERNIEEPYTQIVQNCNYLHKLLSETPPKLLIHDQDVAPEFYFADRVCTKLNIPQVVTVTDFFQRSLFYKKLSKNNAEIYKLRFDDSIDREKVEGTLNEFMKAGTFLAKAPDETIFQKVRRKLKKFSSSQNAVKENFSLGTKFFYNIRDSFDTKLQNRLKLEIYESPDYEESYIFLPLHCRIESTLLFRSHPYTDQEFLVSLISRNLPYGMKLYVREHPEWRQQFSAKYLKELSELSNVKVIDPDISIHAIIDASKALAVMNNTTGYEAAIHNKPVVAFSPSPYASHEENFYVSDLYLLDEILQKAVSYKPNKEKNKEFLFDMFKFSLPYHEHSSKWKNTNKADRVGKEFGACFVKILNSIY